MKTGHMEHHGAKVDLRQNDYTSQADLYEKRRFQGRENEYLEMLRRRAVLAGIAAQPRDSSVVDVGCGTGRGLLYLASAGFRHITGLDYTPAMLNIARNHLRDRGLDEAIDLVQGDAFSLPWPANTFDVVVSLNFLHMFRFNLQRDLIREMARVCLPGGVVVAEFESIHKGLFFTRYREQRRLRHRTKFNSIWEKRRLFPASEFSHVRTRGTALPKLYRVLSREPRLGASLESIALWAPFNWLAERVIIAAKKR